jgi:hypothetical protein
MTTLERFLILGMKLERAATVAPTEQERLRLRRLATLVFERVRAFELETDPAKQGQM